MSRTRVVKWACRDTIPVTVTSLVDTPLSIPRVAPFLLHPSPEKKLVTVSFLRFSSRTASNFHT